jgi:GNAT superfamily N-acetyltransferase
MPGMLSASAVLTRPTVVDRVRWRGDLHNAVAGGVGQAYRRAMIRLGTRDFHRVRKLFAADHLSYVLDAMIAGNTPAWVWVDQVNAPGTALVWDRGHCVYLAGDIARHSEACRATMDREITPASRNWLKLYADDDAAAVFMRSAPALSALQRRERVLYRGFRARVPDTTLPLPAGFRISRIDDRLIDPGTLANSADVIAEVESGWGSVTAFLRTGFGFAVHDDATIVCWCTAEYVSDERCGIGIETTAAYQRRGFATATATAFVQHCVKRGLTPHWDAWTTNMPSVAVAKKLGFVKVETYSILVGTLAEQSHG